jgi:hypothetical protein
MAGVLALLLVVPGALIAMPLGAVAWTALFACLHLMGELARWLREHLRTRAEDAEVGGQAGSSCHSSCPNAPRSGTLLSHPSDTGRTKLPSAHVAEGSRSLVSCAGLLPAKRRTRHPGARCRT